MTRPTCQRVGCDNPSVYGVKVTYHGLECETTLGVCEQCKPYFIEKILPELFKTVTFDLIPPY